MCHARSALLRVQQARVNVRPGRGSASSDSSAEAGARRSARGWFPPVIQLQQAREACTRPARELPEFDSVLPSVRPSAGADGFDLGAHLLEDCHGNSLHVIARCQAQGGELKAGERRWQAVREVAPVIYRQGPRDARDIFQLLNLAATDEQIRRAVRAQMTQQKSRRHQTRFDPKVRPQPRIPPRLGLI